MHGVGQRDRRGDDGVRGESSTGEDPSVWMGAARMLLATREGAGWATDPYSGLYLVEYEAGVLVGPSVIAASTPDRSVASNIALSRDESWLAYRTVETSGLVDSGHPCASPAARGRRNTYNGLGGAVGEWLQFIGDGSAIMGHLVVAVHPGGELLGWDNVDIGLVRLGPTSPDGRWLVGVEGFYTDAIGSIAVHGVEQGRAGAGPFDVTLGEVEQQTVQPSWSPDGRWLAYPSGEGLSMDDPFSPMANRLFDMSGDTPSLGFSMVETYVTVADTERGVFSPDSSAYHAFSPSSASPYGWEGPGIDRFDLQTRSTRRVVEEDAVRPGGSGSRRCRCPFGERDCGIETTGRFGTPMGILDRGGASFRDPDGVLRSRRCLVSVPRWGSPIEAASRFCTPMGFSDRGGVSFLYLDGVLESSCGLVRGTQTRSQRERNPVPRRGAARSTRPRRLRWAWEG